ncbi:MAG TPA: copper amine oxidase N-terminal domain-containing protein [Epulopiscium sp.]|nr:copper amine oxidase N-terminal domain-containing protein [Candidatus Epulonipiscium sp.]
MNTIDHSLVTEYTSYGMTGLDKDIRDIIIATVPKNNLTTKAVREITLKKYVETDENASIPQLVKIDENIIFKVGDKNANIKDANRVIKMDMPAEMKNGTTYVPIRFVSETLNHKVEYKKHGQVDRINIIKDYKTRFNSKNKDIDPSYFGKILNIDLKANEVYFKVLKFVFDNNSAAGYYVDDLKDLSLFRLAPNAEFYVIDFYIESDDASRRVTKEEFSLQLSSFELPNSTMTSYYTLETNGEEIVKVKAFYTP